MFLDVRSQPEFGGFLAPPRIGILGHSQICEIVNREIRQQASQRRQAGCFANSVGACDEEEHLFLFMKPQSVELPVCGHVNRRYSSQSGFRLSPE
jgi:hypothetical protein